MDIEDAITNFIIFLALTALALAVLNRAAAKSKTLASALGQ